MSAHLTLAAFRVRFPGFKNHGDELVQAALDEAALEVPEDVWGDLTGAGHGNLTAVRLAGEPFGRDTKASVPSPYLVEYERLARAVGTAAAPRVT